MERRELKGLRFGLWTVKGPDHSSGREWFWRCVCDCGAERVIRGYHLTSGHSSSCGCLKAELLRHRDHTIRSHAGLSQTAEYRAWANMMNRCYNPAYRNYRYWGGRGIKVCDRWHDFEAFVADMGKPPPDRSLDRIDNASDYALENCRWATRSEQRRNQRPRGPYGPRKPKKNPLSQNEFCPS